MDVKLGVLFFYIFKFLALNDTQNSPPIAVNRDAYIERFKFLAQNESFSISITSSPIYREGVVRRNGAMGNYFGNGLLFGS